MAWLNPAQAILLRPLVYQAPISPQGLISLRVATERNVL